VNENPGIVFRMEHRIRSFIAILLAGVLFVAVLLAEGILALLRNYIAQRLPEYGFVWNGIINQVISLIVVTVWFAMLFKFLADGKPAWRITFAGALFTGILFTGGKLLIKLMLSYSNMQTIVGASTSMALLLLFVFYSSFIFYYGACFTKVFAEFKNQPIPPGKHAVKYFLSQVELDSK
jgi:membrane protein